MSDKSSSQVITTLAVALAIFLLAIVVPKLLLNQPRHMIAATQGLELLLSLLAIVIFGKSKFSHYGFCRPQSQDPLAGHLRAKTGSLIPAIVVHMLANIGGMIGGIIFTLINFTITGKLPTVG